MRRLALLLAVLSVSRLAQGECTNPCPHGGTYDGANCLVSEPPPGARPFIYSGNFYYIPLSSNPATRCPVGSYDGANCLVSITPSGATPFIYEGRYYYVRTCCPPCPYGGTFDTANCYIAKSPGRPFIYQNNFYYFGVSTDPSTRCPIGGWDGAHCQVGTNNEEAVPFIYSGNFYLLSACDPRFSWSGWSSKGNTYGTTYARTKHKKVQLRWDLTGDGINAIGQLTGGGGLNPASVQYIKLCRKAGTVGNPCNRGDRRFLPTWRTNYIYHDLTPGQRYRFRVMVKPDGGPEMYIGKAINVKVK